MHEHITAEDRQRLAARGISEAEIERQLQLFAHPPAPLVLERPCTRGDGIRVIGEADWPACLDAWEAAHRAGRLLKFVPASGAASRMFQAPLQILATCPDETRTALRAQSADDDAARQTLELLDNLSRFAFETDLRQSMRADGRTLDPEDVAGVLEYLLTPVGLDYANRPKGLLAFHHDPAGPRTAFEEHLTEGALYASGNGTCRMHFTVSPQHRTAFEDVLERVRSREEKLHGCRFEISFSAQAAHTDMIAVDLDNTPFRLPNGELLFRPGGHGSLIENLSQVQGDIVFLKNIDNVTTPDQNETTVLWKKLLAGTLLRLQEKVFQCIERLEGPAQSARDLEEAARLVREDLDLDIPDTLTAAGPEDLRLHLLQLLKRPLRVCGMVRNTGEPGGGPFWVRDPQGHLSRQIVERAQIDPHAPSQQSLFSQGTHFNPVDLVCGLRDHRGRAFDLSQFIDPQAVFLSEKSSGGRSLKAIERPGLWNGAMAHWITVFVEVPLETFSPVKTVLDLLRPAHQPRKRSPRA